MGEPNMINLSRLNKEVFLVNCDLIEFIDEAPDTVISMVSGRKLIVSESCEEVKRRVIEYKRQIYCPGYADKPEK
jgi:flagellar protein FlbD